MFNTKAKSIYTLYYLIEKVFWIIFFIVQGILIALESNDVIDIIPHSLFKEANDANSTYNTFVSVFFWASISLGAFCIIGIARNIFKYKCINYFVHECQDIINTTKITKAPKVVYVYTIHNDMIESRFLENIKQTYKNLEVWISDGSSKKEYQKYIRTFAKKHNINLMQMPLPGSKHKADNLNFFLRNYQGKFDYLLIGDCDVAINPNFAEHAVKIYLSKKTNNIGFISSLSYCYRSKGLFTNSVRYAESLHILDFFIGRCFRRNHTSSLTSQVCLVNKKLLDANGGLFSDVPLEDWFLETCSVENNFFGIILPTAICYHEFDTSITAYCNRNNRIYSWIIYWWKHDLKNKLDKFNFKYTQWYLFYFIRALMFIIPIVVLFGLCFVVWFFINYWTIALQGNIMFYIFIGLITFYILIIFTYSIIWIINIKDNWFDLFAFLPMAALWFIPMTATLMWTGFKAMFFGKYMAFGGSGQTRTNKKIKKSVLLKSWAILTISGLVIVAYNLCSYYLLVSNFLPLDIVMNVYFGALFISALNYILVHYLNFIPTNAEFSRKNVITFNNKKHNFQRKY